MTRLNYIDSLEPQQAQTQSQKAVPLQPVSDKQPIIVTPKVETAQATLQPTELKAPAATIQAVPSQKVEVVPPTLVAQEPKTPTAVQTVASQKTDTIQASPAVQEPKTLAPIALQDNTINSPSKPNIFARAYNTIKTFFHNVGAIVTGNRRNEGATQTPVKQIHQLIAEAPAKSQTKGKTAIPKEIMSKHPVDIGDNAFKPTSKRASLPKRPDNKQTLMK